MVKSPRAESEIPTIRASENADAFMAFKLKPDSSRATASESREESG
jgi:hypothetical protein